MTLRACLPLSTVVVGFLATVTLTADPFTVSATDSATTLVNTIVGTGVSVVGTPTLSSVYGQSGTFTNFSSGTYTQSNGTTGSYTIPSGIILTNGYATGAMGNYTGGASTGLGGPGAPELTALSGYPTYDADILKFSFTSTSPTLYFNFAFASTEYPVYVGSQFNDVFGFFVNGVNVGVVPGTTTPVAVNSVNAGTNSNYFTQYSTATTPFDYGGLTTLLTATANVSTTSVNTIEFAIADSSDDVLDSAVLIQGGSVGTVIPTTSPEPATSLLMGCSLLFGGALLAIRRKWRSKLSLA